VRVKEAVGVLVIVEVFVRVKVAVGVKVWVGVGLQPEALFNISMPATSALSTEAVSTISINPPVTGTKKVWI
jgi:hypothetical protein